MERPKCERADCFAYKDGSCVVLRSNDFKSRACPFFKDKEIKAVEDARCAERAARKKELAAERKRNNRKLFYMLIEISP